MTTIFVRTFTPPNHWCWRGGGGDVFFFELSFKKCVANLKIQYTNQVKFYFRLDGENLSDELD